jgi:hypothetical protein
LSRVETFMPEMGGEVRAVWCNMGCMGCMTVWLYALYGDTGAAGQRR